MSRGQILIGLLLGLSLVFNLLLMIRSPTVAPCPESNPGSAGASSKLVTHPMLLRRLAKLAGGPTLGTPVESPSSPSSWTNRALEPDGGRDPHPLLNQDVDLELQQTVLCDFAKQNLREGWLGAREEITSAARRSIETPENQQNIAQQELKLMAYQLGLDPQQRQALTREYLPLRTRKLEEARAVLSTSPVPYKRLTEVLRSFYKEEDQLVQSLFGEQARLQLRLASMEQRTSLMALVVTLAGGELGDAISW